MGTRENIDFFMNGLCIHCHLAKQELAEFMHFNKESELAWGNKDKQLQNDLDSILREYPESDHDEIIESYGWDLHVNQVKYPSIHRESTVLTIFSFLEYEINNLCNILTQSVDGSVTLRDLKGQGVERAFLYLRKIAGFDFSAMSKEIDYIRGVNKLRNHIVHNGGVLPKESTHRVNVFIGSHQSLLGEPSNRLHIHEEFVPELIQILLDFFTKLQSQVSEHIKAYNRDA